MQLTLSRILLMQTDVLYSTHKSCDISYTEVNPREVSKIIVTSSVIFNSITASYPPPPKKKKQKKKTGEVTSNVETFRVFTSLFLNNESCDIYELYFQLLRRVTIP